MKAVKRVLWAMVSGCACYGLGMMVSHDIVIGKASEAYIAFAHAMNVGLTLLLGFLIWAMWACADDKKERIKKRGMVKRLIDLGYMCEFSDSRLKCFLNGLIIRIENKKEKVKERKRKI